MTGSRAPTSPTRNRSQSSARIRVVDAMGAHSLVAQRLVCRGQHDQREIGNCEHQTRVPLDNDCVLMVAAGSTRQPRASCDIYSEAISRDLPRFNPFLNVVQSGSAEAQEFLGFLRRVWFLLVVVYTPAAPHGSATQVTLLVPELQSHRAIRF